MAQQSNTGSFAANKKLNKNDQFDQQQKANRSEIVKGSATPSSTGTGVGGTGSENNLNSQTRSQTQKQ